MKSPVCDHKTLVELIMQISECYDSIMSAYRSIEFSIRLIMELFCAFWARIRSFKGESIRGDLVPLWNEKKIQIRTLGAYS